MNSNLYTSNLKIYNPMKPSYGFRETFGTINPITKLPYTDLLRTFLIARRITVQDLHNGYIYEPANKQDSVETPFLLHLDDKTWFKILRTGEENCIISYQMRTTGNFAFARLFIERN